MRFEKDVPAPSFYIGAHPRSAAGGTVISLLIIVAISCFRLGPDHLSMVRRRALFPVRIQDRLEAFSGPEQRPSQMGSSGSNQVPDSRLIRVAE